MIGPHHSIICSFTGTGHGAAAWMIVSSDETSAAAAHVLGQLQQPREHRGHHLAVGDPVLRDEVEVLRGIEALHDHRRRAEAHRGRHAGLRRRVVQRRRRQVAHALAEAEHVAHELHHRHGVGGMHVGQRAQDALRPTGRARRVQHRRAELLVVDRRGRVGIHHVEERLEAAVGMIEIDHQPALHVRAQRRQRQRDVALVDGRHDHLRLRVVDDVGDFVGRQVRVDAREVQAGALGGALALEQARVVLGEEGDVVGAAQAHVAVEMGDAIGARLVLAQRHGLARRRHDEGGVVGTFHGMLPRVHARRLYAGSSNLGEVTELDARTTPHDMARRDGHRRTHRSRPRRVGRRGARLHAARSTGARRVGGDGGVGAGPRVPLRALDRRTPPRLVPQGTGPASGPRRGPAVA